MWFANLDDFIYRVVGRAKGSEVHPGTPVVTAKNADEALGFLFSQRARVSVEILFPSAGLSQIKWWQLCEVLLDRKLSKVNTKKIDCMDCLKA